MSNEFKDRLPTFDEIFPVLEYGKPTAPNVTNWTPILLTASALIVSGAVIYLVVDHVSKRQTEMMVTEIWRNRDQQQTALKAQKTKLDQIHAASTELAADHQAFADWISVRMDQFESGLTKPGPPALPVPNNDSDTDI